MSAVLSYYGLIDDTNTVQNRVVWDGISTVTWNDDLTAIIDPTGIAEIGGTWNGTTFVPVTPTAVANPSPDNSDGTDYNGSTTEYVAKT